MKITILGGGSWGTALAVHLAKNNHQIKVWEFFVEQAERMQQERICPLLPKAKLSEKIIVTANLEEALNKTQLILVVVPSDKVVTTLKNAAPYISEQKIIICSKGFTESSELLSDAASRIIINPLYCLYGPTHAEEVCQGLFSGLVLAGGEGKAELRKVLASADFKIDLSEDLVGVQVASALKNILAIFIGITEGAGLGDNLKAYMMTKGLHEIKEIGLKLGAEEQTFFGLAGMGDLIVTCTSKHSRNRHLGEQIGKGRKLAEVLSEMKMVVEGVNAVKNALKFKEKFGLKLPVITAVYEILFKNKPVEEAIKTI